MFASMFGIGSAEDDEAVGTSGAEGRPKSIKRRGTLANAFSAAKKVGKLALQIKSENGAKTLNRTIPGTVTSLKVTFPLPCKDPLVPFRRISDLAKAFEVDQKNILDSFQDIALEALEFKYRNSPAAEVKTDKQSLVNSYSSFEAKCSIKTQQSSTSGDKVISDNVTTEPMRVVGCAIPELGAHVLIGLIDDKGVSHGELCVSMTEIIDVKSNSKETAIINDIPVSQGGELRGKASGKFSIALLTIASLDYAMKKIKE